MKKSTTTTKEATTEATVLTLEERNAVAEKQAQKRLKNALFNLYHNDRVAFVKALQFNENNAVKRFTTKYNAEAEDGSMMELETGIRFTIFDLWNDENDPKKMQRKAINAFVKTIGDEASVSPTKAVKNAVVAFVREVLRLLGFADFAEKIDTSHVKRILANAYRLTDNAKDDARDKEVKRGIQSILWLIVTTAKGGNARTEREAKKTLEKIGDGKNGETTVRNTTVESEKIDDVTIA